MFRIESGKKSTETKFCSKGNKIHNPGGGIHGVVYKKHFNV